MSEPLPDEDLTPVADPFEAELVAYLDGELEAPAARRVEARLATDPQARAKAAALKKTFDLLDYLPKPEPSATFATRTIDKLPVLQTGAMQQRSQPTSAVATLPSKPSRHSQPVASALATRRANSSMAQSRGAMPLSSKPHYPRRIAWAAGILVALLGFATAGYFGGAAMRSHQSASRTGTTKETPDELAASDHRLIENLPYYANVDDYAFANELAKPEFFGEDPAVSYDSVLKVPNLPPEQPTGTAFANLEKAFMQLPPDRQQAIRELDKHLSADPPAQRDRLLRVLEAYAVWLNNLPDLDRKGILTAAAAESRLKLIRTLRQKQVIDSLPLSGVNGDLNSKLAEEFRANEIRRHEEWKHARKHPELLDGSKAPWPFDNETLKAEIMDFAKLAFRLDDKDVKGSRLTANELERYTSDQDFALKQGGAAWSIYGRTLYELIKRHEDLLLPPPADPGKRYTDIPELPPTYRGVANQQQLKKRLAPFVGKWPEFPLELHKDLLAHKETKSELKNNSPLGPARVSDFTPKVKEFVETKMLKDKLSDQERKRLQQREDKWPEYPRELIQLAREHNLSIPGVMLPGPPKQWEALYGRTIK